jgi:hypothetical protein
MGRFGSKAVSLKYEVTFSIHPQGGQDRKILEYVRDTNQADAMLGATS